MLLRISHFTLGAGARRAAAVLHRASLAKLEPRAGQARPGQARPGRSRASSIGAMSPPPSPQWIPKRPPFHTHDSHAATCPNTRLTSQPTTHPTAFDRPRLHVTHATTTCATAKRLHYAALQRRLPCIMACLAVACVRGGGDLSVGLAAWLQGRWRASTQIRAQLSLSAEH